MSTAGNMALLIDAQQVNLFDIKDIKTRVPDFPGLDLQHIKRLTTATGIIQHAKYATPDYRHGYCLDDNARALLLAGMAYEICPSTDIKNLTSTYLAYIYYMQNENGSFRNFLSFDHSFLDEQGTEDSFGRAIWALGSFVRGTTQVEFVPLAREIFLRAIPHSLGLRSARANAYSLLGLLHYVQKYPDESMPSAHLLPLLNFLVREHQESLSPGWHWYEKVISYDNAIIPLCVLRTAQYFQDETVLQIGLQSACFLDTILFEKDYLSTIGNEGWYREGATRSTFGQQPIEIPSIILLYKELYLHGDDPAIRQKALKAFEWFFGKNELGLRLYDTVTKGCCDGLDSHGINFNQGAESTISFWLAYLYLRYPFR
jgi:hypothetical protein